MTDRDDPRPVTRLVKRLSLFASTSAVFAVLAGISALAGWKFHIAVLDTWMAAPVRIVPNAAACLLLLGISLWLLNQTDNQSGLGTREFAGKSLAAIVCLVSLLSLAEHVLGWNFRLDQLVFLIPPAETIAGVRPGLMSTIAALNFLALGSALLLLNWKTPHEDWLAQFLAFGTAIGAVFGFFALVLQPKASSITMALPTVVTSFVLACGLICARATWVVGGLLVSQSAGARLLRKVIPAALLVFSFIGWSISKALLTEALFTWVEASLLAILCGALLVGFITWIAFIGDRSEVLNAELERRVAERTAALGESEGRLAGVIQSAMDAIITVDEQQNILLFNGAAERMFRCSAAEALGQPIVRLIPQRFHAAHAGHIESFGETGVTTRSMGALGTLCALRADGQELQVEASISQIEASGKKMFTVILRDITERKRTEEALLESERRYRVLFSEMVDGFALLEVICDENGQPCDCRYLETNRAFETQSGLPGDRVLGKTIREVLPGLDPFWIETYGKVATTGDSIHFESYVQPLERWLEVTAFRARPDQVGVTFADITERKRAEEVRERFAAVVESSDDAIISKTLEGTITAWNSSAERLFGYSAAEALGKSMRMLLPPERADEERDILARIGRGERMDHFETLRVRKNGKTIDVSATISPIKDSRGAIVGVSKIARDITSRKEAEKQLAVQAVELTRKAEELTRSNAELEQFAYIASHDLQEPLRMVAAYTQLLAERYRGRLDENSDKFMGYACEGALRMQALIQDLLAFSRVGRNCAACARVDCEAAIEEVLLSLGPAIHESGALVTHTSLPTVWADRSQLTQVFQNLVGNAIKFHGNEPPAISVRAEKAGEQWLFSVSDNGIGIAPEYAENIFVVFQRLHTRTEYPGNGIGLAICKKIIERWGGKIWVEPHAGHGSIFKFTLPCNGPAEDDPAEEELCGEEMSMPNA